MIFYPPRSLNEELGREAWKAGNDQFDIILSGKGGIQASGRWHSKGRPIVYTSESLALASLEFLVNIDIDLMPTDLVSVRIEIPDGIKLEIVPLRDLPRKWRQIPPPLEIRHRGNHWLDLCETPVLKVPSAVIPSESNYLINPYHPDAHRIRALKIEKFRLPRL